MKTLMTALLAWLLLAASAFAAFAVGTVAHKNQHGLGLSRPRYNDRLDLRFSDGLKKGQFDKKKLVTYPHLPKDVAVGDTIEIEYLKENQDLVITHICIVKKANGGPVPPPPPGWDVDDTAQWIKDWKNGKGVRPPKAKKKDK